MFGLVAGEVSTNALREALRLLVYASGLLAAPGSWTQRVWARDKHGNSVAPEDRGAVSFCLAAAVFRAAYDLYATQVESLSLSDPGERLEAPRRTVVALQLLAVPAFLRLAELVGDSPPGRGSKRAAAGEEVPKHVLRIQQVWVPLIVSENRLASREVVLEILSETISLCRAELQARAAAKPRRRGKPA